jgi:hypothetical protein
MSSLPNEWIKALETYPVWGDDGKAIEVFVTEELVRSAKLSAEDCWHDGEDDIPIWFVRFENGQRAELVAIPKWRFV